MKGSAMWISLSASVLMMLCLGIFFSWSVFIIPLQAELGCDREEISIVYTVNMISFCIGALTISRMLSTERGFCRALIITALLLFGGFFIAGMATTLWQLYLAYGLIVGIGIGCGYNTVLSTIVKWFPQKNGIISGALLMGYGLGSLFYGSLCPLIIEAVGIRMLFLGFAVVFGAVFVFGRMILLKAYGMISHASAQRIQQEDSDGMPLKKAARTTKFILYYLWILCAGVCCLTFLGNLVPIAVEIQLSQSIAGFLVGMVSFFNGGGRILMGLGYDKLGFSKMYLMVSSLLVIAFCVLYLAVTWVSIPLFVASCGMIGLSLAGMPTATAVFLLKQFGKKYYAENVAGLNTVQAFQALGNVVFVSLMALWGSYKASCLMFLPMIALMLICCLNLIRVIKSQ